MADYTGKILTNYFRVTDADELKRIIASCQATSEVRLFAHKGSIGEQKFSIGSHGYITGYVNVENGTEPMDNEILFFEDLQKILPKDEAILFYEVGNESLCYLRGACTVITDRAIKTVSIYDVGVNLARELLGNTEYKADMYGG